MDEGIQRPDSSDTAPEMTSTESLAVSGKASLWARDMVPPNIQQTTAMNRVRMSAKKRKGHSIRVNLSRILPT